MLIVGENTVIILHVRATSLVKSEKQTILLLLFSSSFLERWLRRASSAASNGQRGLTINNLSTSPPPRLSNSIPTVGEDCYQSNSLSIFNYHSHWLVEKGYAKRSRIFTCKCVAPIPLLLPFSFCFATKDKRLSFARVLVFGPVSY